MDEREFQEKMELFNRAVEEMRTNLVATADTFKKLQDTTQKNNSGLDKANAQLKKFADSNLGKVAIGATKAVGDLAEGFAKSGLAARENMESFEALNPAIKGVAAAIKAFPLVGQGFGEALEGVGEFVTAEMQKTVEAFQTLGDVGAISAGGVSALRDSAQEAGLSFRQLAEITKSNGQTLAFAFGSTSKGLESIADLTTAAEPFRRELLALGFGISEQTEVFTDFIDISRRLGRAQSNDYRMLASGAAEYAKRLDRLSRLTGASTDAIQAELDAQQTNIRFRRALRDLPDITQDAISNVGIVISKVGNDPALTQGFQDMVAGFGTQAARDFAIATGNVGPAVVEQLKSGVMNEQQAVLRIQQSLGRTYESLPEQVLGLGSPFDATAVGMANFADASEFTAERIRKIIETQGLAGAATDEATGQMVNAQLSLQSLAMEIESFIDNKVFPRAAEVVSTLSDGLSELAGKVNTVADGLPGKTRAKGGPVSAGESYLVGELGPEIIVPSSSGTVIPNDQLASQSTAVVQPKIDLSGIQDQLEVFNSGTSSIAAVDIESKLATVRNAMADVPSFVEGFKSAFLPGIGEVAEYAAGNMSTMMIKTLDGQIEEYARYNVPTSGMSVEAFRAGGQTFAQGSYQLGDIEAQTGFTNIGGPRTMYDSIMAGVAPAESAVASTPEPSTAVQTAEATQNREMLQLLQTLNQNMQQVASNTRTGADTSKKLLRASTG